MHACPRPQGTLSCLAARVAPRRGAPALFTASPPRTSPRSCAAPRTACHAHHSPGLTILTMRAGARRGLDLPALAAAGGDYPAGVRGGKAQVQPGEVRHHADMLLAVAHA